MELGQLYEFGILPLVFGILSLTLSFMIGINLYYGGKKIDNKEIITAGKLWVVLTAFPIVLIFVFQLLIPFIEYITPPPPQPSIEEREF